MTLNTHALRTAVFGVATQWLLAAVMLILQIVVNSTSLCAVRGTESAADTNTVKYAQHHVHLHSVHLCCDYLCDAMSWSDSKTTRPMHGAQDAFAEVRHLLFVVCLLCVLHVSRVTHRVVH